MPTTSISTSHIALLVIDNQRGFRHATHWGPQRSNPAYEQNLADLLGAFRALTPKPLIIHVQHLSTEPGSPLGPGTADGAEFEDNSTPLTDEPILTKNVNSAFIGTDLKQRLRRAGVRKLYTCGLTTDHCVSTTTRMAGNLGVTDWEEGDDGGVVMVRKGEVVLVQDATACWRKPDGGFDAETVHAVHVESLKEFASVKTTGEVLVALKKM